MEMPSPPRTWTVDLPHKFDFDLTFDTVEKHSECELKFFCEAFSLIDAMREISVLHEFSLEVKKANGKLECEKIIKILSDNKLIEGSSANKRNEGLYFLLDSLYLIVKNIVKDKFVSCMRTSTLGCIAWEVGDFCEERVELEENNNLEGSNWKEKAKAWHKLGVDLQELAKYQHMHMRIHHDFQKSNPRAKDPPDPRAKVLYTSTFLAIFFAVLYMIVRNCRWAETKEFINLLRK